MKIMQFRDLKTQYKMLKKDIDEAMIKVATECNFISGSQVKKLEDELAKYVGVKHCITCANGTDALSIAMMTWDIGMGDAVFVPDFTFFSSGEIVSHAGATPIFVDVDESTFNISATSLIEKIEEVKREGKLKPKCIIAVDLFGLPADYEEIRKVADKYSLLLLEDGAQGFGGKIDGKAACSFGDISTTSFFPAKPLGCYGDGGAIFTDNDQWADKIRSICVHGKGAMKYDNVRIGLNSRLDTIQAAILSIKLKAFEDYEVDDVNKAAELYTNKIKNSGLEAHLDTPKVPDGFLSSWAQYTLKMKDKNIRGKLQEFLKERGIPTMVYYPKPMHRQEAFGMEHDETLIVTDRLCNSVLSLPMHPYLKEEEIDEVVNAISDFFKK